MSKLHEAVRTGNYKLVSDILKRDRTIVNDWDVNKRSPLHVVFDHITIDNLVPADDRLPIIKLLIDYGADVNGRAGMMNALEKNVLRQTLLIEAIKKKQINTVKFLLENGADPNLSDMYDCPPLKYAVIQNDQRYTKLLLKHGADTKKYTCGYNPKLSLTILDFCIKIGKLNNALLLIEKGAKVDDVYETLLLVLDCKIKFEFVIKYALKIDFRRRFSTDNVMHYLTYIFDKKYYANEIYESYFVGTLTSITQDVRELGIDIKNINDGMKAIHLAAISKNKIKMQILLKSGIEVNVRDKYGNTPLHLLLTNFEGIDQIYHLAKMLIDNGANIRAYNHYGFTPIDMAIRNDLGKVINLMLAKISEVDETLLTNNLELEEWWNSIEEVEFLTTKINELDVAVILGYEDVVDRLIDSKSNIMPTKEFFCVKRPTLYYAIRAQQYNIIKMLFEAGFKIDRFSDLGFNCIDVLDEENNVLLARLMWDMDTRLLTELFIAVFSELVNGEYLVDREFNNLLGFYYVINFRLNTLSKDLIPIAGLIKLSKELSEILSYCNKKLDAFEKFSISSNLTAYDIVSMKIESLVNSVNNLENFLACQKLNATLKNKASLKSYEHIMLERTSLAIERKQIMDVAKKILNKLFQVALKNTNFLNLPDDILLVILSYFNIRELKKLQKLEDLN